MKFILMLIVSLKILTPALLLFYAVYKSFFLLRRRGNIIWKKSIFALRQFAILSIFVLIYSIYIIASENLWLSILYFVFFIIFSFSLLNHLVIGMLQGVYSNCIISNKGSYKWDEIEKVIILEDGLVRFIHKKMGAFDLEVGQENATDIECFIKDKFPNYL